MKFFRYIIFAAVFTVLFSSCAKDESSEAPKTFDVYYAARVPAGYNQTITFIQGIGVRSTINNKGSWLSSAEHPVNLRSGDSVLLDIKAVPPGKNQVAKADSIQLTIRTVSPDKQTVKHFVQSTAKNADGTFSARIALKLP